MNESVGSEPSSGGGGGGDASASSQAAQGEPGRTGKRRRRRRGKRGAAQPGGAQPAANGHEPQAGGQPQLVQVEGILDSEVRGPNAFLRKAEKNYLPSPDDAEVPKHLVQRLRLRPGARIGAQAQSKGKLVVQRIDTVDGLPPDQAWNRPDFASLTVIDPIRRIRLETTGKESLTRVLDLIAPIGFGQRALIVAPPKTGKTIMLQKIAQAVSANYPEAHLMVLLVDERPEEVTDMRRSIKGDVLASSSDRSSADHLKVAEMTLERAKRLVEQGKDVVILLD
ncbi:MAG TPA: transcription termination factor Rho, partial [Vulgatibacter sp.]